MGSYRRARAAAAAVIAVLLGVPLVMASVEEIWARTEITPGRQPVRYVVTKTGRRGGPQAWVVHDPDAVRSLYTRLAGNSRAAYTCGYHWNILFEYRDGPAESVDINETCETFRKNPKETWQAVESAFTRARTEPPHFYVILSSRDPQAGAHLRTLLQPLFGTVIDSSLRGRFLLVSRQQWPDTRVAALRKTCGASVTVEIPKEFDTGN